MIQLDYQIPTLPLSIDVETKAVLRQLNAANRKLAEYKVKNPSCLEESL